MAINNVRVARRDESVTDLYWSPDGDTRVVSYKLYYSLQKDTGYVLGIDNIRNVPDRAGSVPGGTLAGNRFVKPGSISRTFSQLNVGITCDQEYYIKVTSILNNGFECSLDSVSYTLIRTEGNNSLAGGINFEWEKGVLGWEESNNVHRRVNVTPKKDSNEATFSLDVHTVDSKVEVTNEKDNTNTVVPLEIAGMLNPAAPGLVRNNSTANTLAAELEVLEAAPSATKPWKLHSVGISSNIALDGEFQLCMRVNGSDDFLIDARELISADGDNSYFLALPDGELILNADDILVIKSTGLTGQNADLKITVLKSVINEG